MIRVTVELVPQGVEHEKTEIGYMKITNNMTGTPEKGNYTICIGVQGKNVVVHELNGFERLERDVFDLIKEALNKRK